MKCMMGCTVSYHERAYSFDESKVAKHYKALTVYNTIFFLVEISSFLLKIKKSKSTHVRTLNFDVFHTKKEV